MSARRQFEVEKRRKRRAHSKTIRSSFALAVIVASVASVSFHFLPGSTIACEMWLDRHADLVAPVLFTLLAAGVALFLASRFRSKERRLWYLARNYLTDIRWTRSRVSPAAILGAVDSAAEVNTIDLRHRAEWPLCMCRIILLTGALGFTLRVMNWFERLVMPGSGSPYEYLHVFVWSFTPLALALGAVIPITVLSVILKRRTKRRVAEVRAVARVLAEHAAKRASEREPRALPSDLRAGG